MRGWGWQQVHDPAVLPSVLEQWQYTIRTGAPFEMVFPLRGADGRFRAFLTRVEPIKDERGRVIRWFGTNTDVTAQQEVEQREKKARETAEVLNRVGSVLTAELEPERLTQKITDIATLAVRAEFGAFFRNVRDESGDSYLLYTLSGVPQEAFANVPMPRNTPLFDPTFRGDGVVRCDDVTTDPRFGKNPPCHGMPESHLPVRSYLAVPVKSRTGEVLGGLFFGHSKVGVFTGEAETIASGIAAQAAIALDNASLFDETRRSTEALRRSNEELTRLNEDLKQFAYSASHDLREPLRMVSIYTQFLSRKLTGRLDAESQKFIEHILKAASRLEALIRDLLAYTRAAEMTGLEPAFANGNEALKAALANLSAAIEEAGATVSISGSELPNVAIAEVHLAQILQNLIGNAIKYRGQSPPDVRVGAVRRNDQWEFFVTDNGIGIDEDYKEQIFGIFRRLHNANEYSGTGIGLAICQRVVQRYGGRIWVESKPGRGSTFFFTVPAAG
jgi:signal transduction histidine kinase